MDIIRSVDWNPLSLLKFLEMPTSAGILLQLFHLVPTRLKIMESVNHVVMLIMLSIVYKYWVAQSGMGGILSLGKIWTVPFHEAKWSLSEVWIHQQVQSYCSMTYQFSVLKPALWSLRATFRCTSHFTLGRPCWKHRLVYWKRFLSKVGMM